MFNKKRGGALYWALGIAGAVVMAAAGTGTWFFTRGKNKRTRDMTAQAKRVITRMAAKRKQSGAKHTNHHAKTNHVTNGHAHTR